MTPLTAKQEKLWRFIASCERAPSYYEMRDATGFRAISGIQRSLARLEELGYISRVKNRKRGIELLRMPDGVTATFKSLSDWSDAELQAELDRRHQARVREPRQIGRNWMTDARIGSTRLLRALELSGVRP